MDANQWQLWFSEQSIPRQHQIEAINNTFVRLMNIHFDFFCSNIFIEISNKAARFIFITKCEKLKRFVIKMDLMELKFFFFSHSYSNHLHSFSSLNFNHWVICFRYKKRFESFWGTSFKKRDCFIYHLDYYSICFVRTLGMEMQIKRGYALGISLLFCFHFTHPWTSMRETWHKNWYFFLVSLLFKFLNAASLSFLLIYILIIRKRSIC